MEMELDLVLNGLILNSLWKRQEPKVLEIQKTYPQAWIGGSIRK
jgi:hypothetical protein